MAKIYSQAPSLNGIDSTDDALNPLLIQATFDSSIDSVGDIEALSDTFALGCYFLDIATGNSYKNDGTVAVPVLALVPDTGSGITELTGDVTAGPGVGTEAATIAAGAVTKAKLATGVKASHMIVYAGKPTTVGGAAAEAFTVTGAAATDLAFVQVVDNGTANVTVLQAVVTLNTLTVTFSGNPGNDTIINYQIVRATS